jgi:phosphotransferase system enzyme I (PtsI)
MILADPELAETPKQLIRERRCNAEWALVQQMELLVGQFERFDDQYLRERSYDVRQVVERVIKELVGQPGRMSLRTGKGIKEENLIVVAHDLSPADVIAYKEHHFAAFVTDVGGSTSHTAILARSLRIPAVLGLLNARQLIRDKEVLIVDGTRGVLIVNPDVRMLDEFRLRKSQIELERSKLRRLKTAGRQRSTGSISTCTPTSSCRATWPMRSTAVPKASACSAPSSFFSIAATCRPRTSSSRLTAPWSRGWPGGRSPSAPSTSVTTRICIRRRFMGDRLQSNPALGLRAIRLSLAEPKMFQTQLRAILRASKYGKIKLLIPMLSQAHEIDQTLAAIERAKSSLRGERVVFDEAIQVGAMIEIPAAALAIGLFLRRVHFLSIGTNDLIQYTLAIDRSDEQVAHLYDPLHPAVLMLLAHTIASAEKVNIPVSICGELAGDPLLTRLLLGMGLRQFSMHPAQSCWSSRRSCKATARNWRRSFAACCVTKSRQRSVNSSRS